MRRLRPPPHALPRRGAPACARPHPRMHAILICHIMLFAGEVTAGSCSLTAGALMRAMPHVVITP